MKADPRKTYILLSNDETEMVTISDIVLTSSIAEKLLGITLNSELKFEKTHTGIRNKNSQKRHVMSRNKSYMSLHKWRLLMKTFVEF